MTDRIRTGTARLTPSDACRLHHGHHERSGDDRTRTGGDSAGGIRTHDLELMRLARTAAPLPRESGRQESNLRSPAPEAGGVATLPYDQKKNCGRRDYLPSTGAERWSTPSGAIRCLSARLPATIVDRQRYALPP